MVKRIDYNELTKSPYDSFLHRQDDLSFSTGENVPKIGAQNMMQPADQKDKNGLVERAAVRNDGAMSDVWIKNFLRSVDWKPKSVGFYINGQTGYAEFTNIYVSGTINATFGALGGFTIGPDYIRDTGNTMGLASTVTGGNDVRFWAGNTFLNRNTAPFRVYEDGSVAVNNISITGGSIDGGTLVPGTVDYSALAYPPLSGVVDPTTTPGKFGQIYVNTLLGRVFIAIGSNSDADWVLISTSGTTRTKLVSDNVTVSEAVTIRVVGRVSLFDTVTITENFAATIV